jgi:hypothetical protein
VYVHGLWKGEQTRHLPSSGVKKKHNLKEGNIAIITTRFKIIFKMFELRDP